MFSNETIDDHLCYWESISKVSKILKYLKIRKWSIYVSFVSLRGSYTYKGECTRIRCGQPKEEPSIAKPVATDS
jgi:hypothetical protein